MAPNRVSGSPTGDKLTHENNASIYLAKITVGDCYGRQALPKQGFPDAKMNRKLARSQDQTVKQTIANAHFE
jgi:hypothetical protein